jgi:outer membrane protein assembly factor BamD (BamD/ComL family)
MKLKILPILFTLFLLLYCSLVYALEDDYIYREAIKAAKTKDFAYAFMSFRYLLTNFPDSKYTEDALFATGEYYFLIGDYTDARPALIKFINEYPDSKAKPFALVYLLKITEKQTQRTLAQGLEKEIVTSRQLVLLFKDFKEFQYLSPLNRRHKVVHFIDKVEFYIDGELFAKIFY